MSGPLQSGQHPDADQLNAFVEDALPAHEREETLAHLALCADCRAVVALSMPPVDETLPQPGPARRRWSLGWKQMLGPIAATATLAAFVAATTHIRNVSIAPIAKVAPQMARNETPPPTQLTGAADSRERRAPATAMQAAPGPFMARPVNPTKPAKASGVSGVPQRGGAGVPLPAAVASAPAMGAASGGSASANGAGIALDREAAALPSPPLSMPEGPPQTAAALNSAPYAAPPAAADETATSAAVVLQSARGVAAPSPAQAVLRIHPLPSGLPALSIVTDPRQGQTLAVDLHGALFLTADSAEHWMPVAPPWPGRAVRVDLVNPGPSRASRFLGFSAMKQGPQFAAPAGSMGGPVRISSGAVLSSVSGTVTDTSGATIPGATVTVSASPTQLARMAKTDAAGHYVVDGLVPGNYSVEADSPGFNRQQLAGVGVSPGKPATADLKLSVAASTQTVEVTSASNQIVLDQPPAKKKAPAPAKAAAPYQPVFEITTDTGEHWTSSDGVVWKPRADSR